MVTRGCPTPRQDRPSLDVRLPSTLGCAMGAGVGRIPSKFTTTGAAVLAVLLLTGAQSSCQQRSQSGSSVRSESTVESNSDSSSGSSSRGGVRYSVTSDARIQSVTFVDRQGKKTTKTPLGSSWHGTGPASHGYVMISATTGSGSTMIKCSVTVNGKVVQRASAVGGGSTTVVCAFSY